MTSPIVRFWGYFFDCKSTSGRILKLLASDENRGRGGLLQEGVMCCLVWGLTPITYCLRSARTSPGQGPLACIPSRTTMLRDVEMGCWYEGDSDVLDRINRTSLSKVPLAKCPSNQIGGDNLPTVRLVHDAEPSPASSPTLYLSSDSPPLTFLR